MNENINSNIFWPGWETVGIIGRGSFGEVYKIQRKVMDDVEYAALKVISIPKDNSDLDEMYDEGCTKEDLSMLFDQHLHSIVKEYSTMKKLRGCVNVVGCDDIRYIEHENGIGWDIFIKMELLTPLTQALGKGKIDDETVIKIGVDICTALELCQNNKIVHRDIKPQNIFVSEYGDYKLGDFGIAKTIEKTSGGTKIGTYDFMAPEVFNIKPYGHKADLYSLGIVLYWLLNERRGPFVPLPPNPLHIETKHQANRKRFLGEKIPLPKHGSQALKKVVMKACSFREDERFENATEMKNALLSILGSSFPELELNPNPQPEPNPNPNPNPKPGNGKAIIAVIASVLVVIIAALVGFSIKGKNTSQPTIDNFDTTIIADTTAGEASSDENTDGAKESESSETEAPKDKGETKESDSDIGADEDNKPVTTTVPTTDDTTASVISTSSATTTAASVITSAIASTTTSRNPIVDVTSTSTTAAVTTTTSTTTTKATQPNNSQKVYYNVKLIHYDGKQTVTNERVLSGTAFSALPKPSGRNGQRFVGWTKVEGSTPPNQYTTTVNSNLTLYAKWESNKITVYLNADGGTVSKSYIEVDYLGYYDGLPTPYNKPGYNFAGWYTAKNGGGKLIDEWEMVTTATNHTIYAYWVKK